MLSSLLTLRCQCWLCHPVHFSLRELTDTKSVNAHPISHILWLLSQANTSSLGIALMKSFEFVFSTMHVAGKKESPSKAKRSFCHGKQGGDISSGSSDTLIFIFWPNHCETRKLSISLSFTESKTTKDYCNFDFWITGAIGFLWLHFSLNSACTLEIIFSQLNNCQQCSA